MGKRQEPVANAELEFLHAAGSVSWTLIRPSEPALLQEALVVHDIQGIEHIKVLARSQCDPDALALGRSGPGKILGQDQGIVHQILAGRGQRSCGKKSNGLAWLQCF